MNGRWIGFFLFIWFIGGFLMNNTYNGATNASDWATISNTGNATGIMSDMTGGSVVTQKTPIIGSLSFLVPPVNWVESMWKSVTWQFDFAQPYPIMNAIFRIIGAVGVFMLVMLIYGIVRGLVTWG